MSGYVEPIETVNKELLGFSLPTLFLPINPQMQEFAREVIKKRAVLEQGYKEHFSWSYRRAPHQAVQLIFLQALYKTALESGLIEEKAIADSLKGITSLIEDLFKSCGAQKKEEKDPSYPVLSLSKEHQEEAIRLKESLRIAGFDESVIKLFFDLKTGLFCNFFSDSRFNNVSSFLRYLFFVKEKSRFFHLNFVEKIILMPDYLPVIILPEMSN